jgi:hypothetical protein
MWTIKAMPTFVHFSLCYFKWQKAFRKLSLLPSSGEKLISWVWWKGLSVTLYFAAIVGFV